MLRYLAQRRIDSTVLKSNEKSFNKNWLNFFKVLILKSYPVPRSICWVPIQFSINTQSYLILVPDLFWYVRKIHRVETGTSGWTIFFNLAEINLLICKVPLSPKIILDHSQLNPRSPEVSRAFWPPLASRVSKFNYNM